jgi:GDSL-like lipase/acylhydrolase family protein
VELKEVETMIFSRLQFAHAQSNWRMQVFMSLAALVLLVGAGALGVHSLLAQREQQAPHTATSAAPQRVGPRQYALFLGDSVPYGYQPTGDLTHGYADYWTAEMQRHYPTLIQINMGCYFETTTTMLTGGCPGPATYHVPLKYDARAGQPGSASSYAPYSGQLAAALAFIAAHPGAVSPVVIDLGLNDLVTCYDPTTGMNATCARQALLSERDNLTAIVASVRGALHGTGDVIVPTTYDPLQNVDPSTIMWVDQHGCANPWVQPCSVNSNAVAVANQQHVVLADVAEGVFHTSSYPAGNNPAICKLTHMCDTSPDTHPSTAGYAAIAAYIERFMGY